MATVKCNKPDAEDQSMLDRWINFHGVYTTETDRIEIQLSKELRNKSYIFLFEPGRDREEKFWITRIVLTFQNGDTVIIYSELPVYILENGKTTDRIN